MSGSGYPFAGLHAFVQGNRRVGDRVYLLAVGVPIATKLRLPYTKQTRRTSLTEQIIFNRRS